MISFPVSLEPSPSARPAVFVTWRLEGAMPCRADFPHAAPLTEGQRFLTSDRVMDKALSGPVWLEKPLVAACVSDTLLAAESQWKFCKLLSWVVMPNHIHALLTPKRPVAEIGRAIRKTSARLANEVLGREGLPFWHDGFYEYWPVDDVEQNRILRYIETNPVAAGFAARPEEWIWSSAYIPEQECATTEMFDLVPVSAA